MYAKGLIVSLMICISGFIGVQQPGRVAGDNANPARIYESFIIQNIENSEFHGELLRNSSSASLRRYASLEDKKAQFWYAEQERLVDLMIQKRLDPKQYEIEHFMLNQFYRSLAK